MKRVKTRWPGIYRRGGKYTVWNGKQGQHEFSITCRNRKQAEQLATLINSKNRPKEVEVHS